MLQQMIIHTMDPVYVKLETNEMSHTTSALQVIVGSLYFLLRSFKSALKADNVGSLASLINVVSMSNSFPTAVRFIRDVMIMEDKNYPIYRLFITQSPKHSWKQSGHNSTNSTPPAVFLLC